MLHVLIDIDETILSVPEGINAKASSVMFKKVFGLDADEGMIDNVGKTEMGIIQEVLEKVGTVKSSPERESQVVDVPEEAYQVWGQSTSQELKNHPARVLPGIPELLTALSKDPHVKLGLLTGNSSERAEAKLKSAGLDTFFRDPETQKLIGVFGEMALKRDQLFDLVKRQATPEDRFVIVDDSLIGARMAQTHNIPIVMVATGKATEEQLSPFTPHVFSDFGENRWEQASSLIAGM
ncbi:MAG: HAD superfamily hydrolase [uncultured bacterium]|nr:MAG: HAD superfamily hydrolase [uncultured bacterium]